MPRAVNIYGLLGGFFTCLTLHATPAAARIAEIPYPPSLSYSQAAHTVLVPYFNELYKKPITFKNLSFSLYHALSPGRQQLLREGLDFNVAGFTTMLEGATMDFATGRLTLKSGQALNLPNRTTPERLAVSYAAFDSGAGLVMDFAPLPYKAIFAPMSHSHLRVYTRAPNGTLFDKRYDDLCAELKSVRQPDFYFTLADTSIRGHFDAAAQLPARQQELLADLIAIAIGEQHLQFKFGTPRNRELKSQTAPLYNLAIDTLLFNHNGAMLFSLDPTAKPSLKPGKCNYYLTGYSAKEPLNRRFSQRVAHTLRRLYPYDYAMLANRVAPTHRESLHAIIAYFAGHPERYDMQARMSLKKLFDAMPLAVMAINRDLWTHLQKQP